MNFRKKLAIRLQEAEEQTENALAKCASLDKTKIRLQNEVEDLTIDIERVSSSVVFVNKSKLNTNENLSQKPYRCKQIVSVL